MMHLNPIGTFTNLRANGYIAHIKLQSKPGTKSPYLIYLDLATNRHSVLEKPILRGRGF